jgi:periplasmic protein TonB
MAERKPCIKCGREIDEFARACPYCNWWQSQPVPPQAVKAAEPAVEYVPPPDNRARNKLIGIIGGAVLILLAFIVGAFVHGSDPATAATEELAQNAPATPGTPAPRTTVKLVPVTEGAPPPVFDSPVTGVDGSNAMTNTAGPADFTALPADQYAALAAQQKAQQQAGGTVVDPRTITGSPYAAPPQRPAAAQHTDQPRRVAVVQTQPVPVFQPVPHVRVDREETARLFLTVGTDGRVHDIDVARAAPGVMGPLVQNVQRWRFRPATQGGQPVSSRFAVAITFKP